MHFKRTLLALSVASLMSLATGSSFADTIPTGKAFNDAQSTLNYWTPERLKNAKPVPYPQVDIKSIKIEPFKEHQTSVGAPAETPTMHLKPSNVKLFEPTFNNQNISSPQDVGTGGLHFSSSQLIPLSADLSWPYMAVGKLYFSSTSGASYQCSASVISKRLVVTAGHCVHQGSGGTAGFYTNFLFIPAFRDGVAPYQKWTASYVNTTSAWMNSGGMVPNAGDFALMEMNDNVIDGVQKRISSVTGHLGWATAKGSPNHLHLLGYPCNFDSCVRMHQVTAQNGPNAAPNNATYGSDMGGGSSGGPWIQNFGKASIGQTGGLNPAFNRVVAVTSWGYISTDPKVQGATIFDDSFNALWTQVCGHKVGNCS